MRKSQQARRGDRRRTRGVQEAEFSAYLSLAEGLVAAGGDRERALALARRARDLLRVAGASEPEERAAVERFLAEHDPER